MGMFTDHPNSVGESYLEHMGTASGVGWQMIVGGLACIVHGIFPFWCKATGSKTIKRLSDRLIHNRHRYDGSGPKHQNDWCI